MTLNGHTDVVMSLICWDQFLLSSSLDCTVKVWAATGQGTLEVTYTHNEEHVSDVTLMLSMGKYIYVHRSIILYTTLFLVFFFLVGYCWLLLGVPNIK